MRAPDHSPRMFAIRTKTRSQTRQRVLPCFLTLRVNRNPERKTEDSKENENRKGKVKVKGGQEVRAFGSELRRDAMLTTRRQPRITNGRSLLASRHPSICHPESIRPECVEDLGTRHRPLHFLRSCSFSSRISNRHTAPIRNAVSHSKQRTGTLSNRNKTALFICRFWGDFR